MANSGDVTQLLQRWGAGDAQAMDELLPLLYDELRRLAAAYMRRQPIGHTLQPTALVNEAYLKLAGQDGLSFANRAGFFALAAKMMRQLLVDHARAQNAAKRGGDAVRAQPRWNGRSSGARTGAPSTWAGGPATAVT